ncbi:MAG: hypothetical protein ACLUNZ_00065 [Evtepia sp.]
MRSSVSSSAFDIRVKGSESDVGGEVFRHLGVCRFVPGVCGQSRRAAGHGGDRLILPQITAAETRVMYGHWSTAPSPPPRRDEAKEPKRVEEGAVIPGDPG